MRSRFSVGEKVRVVFDGEVEEISKWADEKLRYKVSDGKNSFYCFEDKLESTEQGGCCAGT